METNSPIQESSCRDLMVLDYVPEVEDIYLDAELDRLHNELSDVQNTLQSMHVQIARAMATLAFRYTNYAMMLRAKVNQLNELEGKSRVTDDVDPVTQLKAEDLEVVNDIQETKDLTRQQNTKIKELFRKISLLTHPDRTKDKDLHDVFVIAKKLLHEGNFNMLKVILNEVKNYVKVRKNKKGYRNFRQHIIEDKRLNVARGRNEIIRKRATSEHQCFVALSVEQTGGEEAYLKYVTEKCQAIEVLILRLKSEEAVRVKQPRPPSQSYFTVHI